jgi:hypothetical protein
MGSVRKKVSDEICAVFDHIPHGFLDTPASRLVDVLPGPTLLDLPGRDPRPLFVSTLLHGNEDSGLVALQEALRRWSSRERPRALLLFIGNVRAAAQNLRTLPGQHDFNRVWPGTATPDAPEARMARWVYDYAAKRNLFASIDIHNNTGFNPHYACVTRLEPRFVALAQLFSRIIVNFERPLGVQAGAFADLCPAVTVECGKTGGGAGSAHAAELIEAAFSITQLPEHPPAPHDVDLLRTFAIVKAPAGSSFSFDGSPADFQFRSDLDQLNFSDLAAGESFGKLGAANARLELAPGDGEHAPEDYFDYSGGDIKLRRGATPSMLTLDPNAVRQDCLCYLMHRIGMDGRRV